MRWRTVIGLIASLSHCENYCGFGATIPLCAADGGGSLRRHCPFWAERGHEFDQVFLPHRGVEMGEVAVRVGAGGDQHVAAVFYPLHCPLDRAELGRIRLVLLG